MPKHTVRVIQEAESTYEKWFKSGDGKVFRAALLIDGVIVEPEPEKAREYYQQSDTPSAKIKLAEMYLLGQGGKVDLEEAERILRPIILSGDEKANNLYGCIQERLGNIEGALASYEKGGANGFYNLATIYETGLGDVGQNIELAVYFLQKAKDKGHIYATYALSRMYEEGRGVPKDSSLAKLWQEKTAPNLDKEQGWKALERSVGNFDTRKQLLAQYQHYLSEEVLDSEGAEYLGDIYRYGIGVEGLLEKDREKAELLVSWLKSTIPQASEKIECLFNTEASLVKSVESASSRASHGFQLIADQEFRDYGNNSTVRTNYLTGAAHYKNSGCMFKLGEICMLDNNQMEAKEWFEKAAQKQNPFAAFALGNLAYASDKAEATEWYKTAVRYAESYEYSTVLDYRLLMKKIAIAYEKGFLGGRDLKRAREYYLRSASTGLGDAMNRLSDFLMKGWGGQKNSLEAITWLKRAFKAGVPTAAATLGLIYLEGQGIEKNIHKSLLWYTSSAKMGDSNAMFMLGKIYDCLSDDVRDYKKAANWYEKAMEAGNCDNAPYFLAFLYEEGLGVEKDIKKSHDLYYKAASQGHRYAEKSLQKKLSEHSTNEHLWFFAKKGDQVAADMLVKKLDQNSPHEQLLFFAKKGDKYCIYMVGQQFENGIEVGGSALQAGLWYARLLDEPIQGLLLPKDRLDHVLAYLEEAGKLYKSSYFLNKVIGYLVVVQCLDPTAAGELQELIKLSHEYEKKESDIDCLAKLEAKYNDNCNTANRR